MKTTSINKRLGLVLGLLVSIIILSGLLTKVKAQHVSVLHVSKAESKHLAHKRAQRKVYRKVKRRAHLRYAHLPKYRATVNRIPKSAIVVRYKAHTYYFNDGVFYRTNNKRYVVIRPVAGVRISLLPKGYKAISLKSSKYYYYYGNFYKDVKDGYEVVEAPEGAMVDALPNGYKVKEIDGMEYYELDGVYYQEVETDELPDGVGYQGTKL